MQAGTDYFKFAVAINFKKKDMSAATNTLRSGIKTRENPDGEPYGHAVEWIEWDSDFRNSTLQHGDIIVGVNDKVYLKQNRESESPKAIGNYSESTYWAEQSGRDGQTINLKICREGTSLAISGTIQEQQFYTNAENRQTLGLNGPARLSNDGFANAWASWYEKFVWHASRYLDDKRWERSVIDNRRMLGEHHEWKERVDYLVKKYPGRFADMALSDWEKVSDILEGTTYSDITDDTLAYRKIGAQRAAIVKEAALKGYSTFINKSTANIIPAFPATDPVHGNIVETAGKIVELPAITFDQFINDLGKSYAVIGSDKDGYYFIHLNSAEMDIFFKTLFHYKSQVTPDVKERFRFIVEILNEPAIHSYQGRAVTGVMVKTIAGIAGEDNVFIKIDSPDKNGRVAFAGEEALNIFSGYHLDDTSSPQQVIEAMIHYVKLGDMQSWKKLFCHWKIYSDWDGPPYMDMLFWNTDESYQHTWEQSRRQILNDIYDARVLHTGAIKTIVHENKETGVPKVEQVKIIIDHVGKIDGIYKSLSNIYVHRKWTLQRLDNGPWKITELQAL